MKQITRLGLPLSFVAIATAACCVLPMAFMLFGLGGSWLAVFGKIAGASGPILILSAIMIALGWATALLRRSLGQQKWLLSGATALTGLASVIYLNEAAINMRLIEMM